MTQLRWYKDTFLVRDVIGHFQQTLPIIVQVDEGYYGILDDECYSKDDMFYITEVRNQPRIGVNTTVVSDTAPVNTLPEDIYNDVTTISIPLDCQLKFHVLGQNDYSSQAKTLIEIQKARQLFEGVRLRPDEHNPVVFKRGFANSQLENIILQDIEVKRFFSQPYLLGFPLPTWDSPYNATEIFPAHMDLKFKVAESLMKGNMTDFVIYKKKLWDSCKKYVHSRKVFGVPEIMLYSEDMKRKEENPYEYLSPADYIRFADCLPNFPRANYTALKPTEYEMTSIRPKAPDPPTTDEKPVAAIRPTSRPTEGQMKPKSYVQHLVTPKQLVTEQRSKQDIESEQQQQPQQQQLQQQQSPESTLGPTNTTSPNQKLHTEPASNGKPIRRFREPAYVVEGTAKVNVVHKPLPLGTSASKDYEDREKIYYDEDCEYASLAEVPKDISQLDVTQIGHCLKLLKLDKYIEAFEEQLIDGALLMELQKDDIVFEFGMTGTEVAKLISFAHNHWRPKVRKKKDVKENMTDQTAL